MGILNHGAPSMAEPEIQESFFGYSTRLNYRRLRVSMLCTFSGFFLHLVFLGYCYFVLGYRIPLLTGLIVNDSLFLLLDSLTLALLNMAYDRMEKSGDYSAKPSRVILFHLALVILFLGPVMLYSLSNVRISFATPYGIICLFLSILFFLDIRLVLAYNLFTLGLSYAVPLFFLTARSLSPLQASTPLVVFIATITASILLQRERRNRYRLLQEALVLGRNSKRDLSLKYSLSDRESEVAILLAEGHSYRKISEMLTISEHTARTHIKHVYEKTGSSSRIQLINLFLE